MVLLELLSREPDLAATGATSLPELLTHVTGPPPGAMVPHWRVTAALVRSLEVDELVALGILVALQPGLRAVARQLDWGRGGPWPGRESFGGDLVSTAWDVLASVGGTTLAFPERTVLRRVRQRLAWQRRTVRRRTERERPVPDVELAGSSDPDVPRRPGWRPSVPGDAAVDVRLATLSVLDALSGALREARAVELSRSDVAIVYAHRVLGYSLRDIADVLAASDDHRAPAMPSGRAAAVRAAGLRRLAAPAGRVIWLALGGFTAWAGLFFARHWRSAPDEHRKLVAGLLLVAVVAPVWVVGLRLLAMRRPGAPVPAARWRPRSPEPSAPSARDALRHAETVLAGEPAVCSPASSTTGRPGRPGRLQLADAGNVELRVLRKTPDLGDGAPESLPPGVIDLVAFLALHARSATGEQIGDALGLTTAAAEDLAEAARVTIGPELLTGATGGPYRLSSQVTCDLRRLREGRQLAAEVGSRGDLVSELDLLHAALALVGDGPPARAVADDAGWLTDEVLAGLRVAVLDTATRLGTLAAMLGALDLVAFAVERGRRLEPDDHELAGLAELTRLAELAGPEEPAGLSPDRGRPG